MRFLGRRSIYRSFPDEVEYSTDWFSMAQYVFFDGFFHEVYNSEGRNQVDRVAIAFQNGSDEA
jgi:hypothetical protein